MDDLFYVGADDVNDATVLEEWNTRLIQSDISVDILCIPSYWRGDLSFMDDLRTSTIEKYGTETN